MTTPETPTTQEPSTPVPGEHYTYNQLGEGYRRVGGRLIHRISKPDWLKNKSKTNSPA